MDENCILEMLQKIFDKLDIKDADTQFWIYVVLFYVLVALCILILWGAWKLTCWIASGLYWLGSKIGSGLYWLGSKIVSKVKSGLKYLGSKLYSFFSSGNEASRASSENSD
jgi:hypothetical protein